MISLVKHIYGTVVKPALAYGADMNNNKRPRKETGGKRDEDAVVDVRSNEERKHHKK